MINLKELEGIGYGLIEVLPQKLAGRTEDSQQNLSVRISGVPAELRTEHFRSTYQERAVTLACGFKKYDVIQILRIAYCFTIYL
jgi:hypothetical protein